jgi:hypothetical protein
MEQLRQLTRLNFSETPDPRGQSAPDTPRAAEADLSGYLTEAIANTLYEPLGGSAISGTYTPTLTNVANLDASTAYSCQYMQVGSVVTVSGRVDIDPTATATDTRLGISLPVASNLAAGNECAGTAFAFGVAGQGAAIMGDATNDRAEMRWVAGDTTNMAMHFSFQYRVI